LLLVLVGFFEKHLATFIDIQCRNKGPGTTAKFSRKTDVLDTIVKDLTRTRPFN
jgi:hypothetical protein